jgi:eukaryotic-like serine/threonine-protein kinase
MALVPGTRLGPYEVVTSLGAGGMGEVYRARDTRLGRDVAIKILPQHLASTPEARQRFEREARAVSSLNHPHICTLYDVGHDGGTDFLVMEYLEGKMLVKRIEKGPLATPELLPIAIQIADALDKAHRQGVIHRDLKPGNIMLTKGGAKLLDFGLAKPANPPAVDLSSSPTMSQSMAGHSGGPLTAKGTILGTLQYMSPEQLEGREADVRSEIFAFGAVLYEMATGRKAFEGKSQATVIGTILHAQPPSILQLQPMSPPALDRLVKVCLAKNPDDRFQTAHDLKLQLEWIQDAGSQAGGPAPAIAQRNNRERIAWTTAAALVIISVLLAIGYVERAPQPAPAIVSQIAPPDGTKFVSTAVTSGPVVPSPDGQRVAFVALGSDGKQLLWVRPLNATSAQPLAGTDGAAFPFWSPDSRYIAFFANGKLNRIDSFGGPPLAIASVQFERGGTWGRDGTILFVPDLASEIYRLPSAGGTPRPVTKLNDSRHETSHTWPQFLPDGRHFLFYAVSGDPENSATYAAALDGGEPKLILRGGSNAVYAPPGYLLFARQGTLIAQRFDAGALRLTGDAVPLAEHVAVSPVVFLPIFSVSENGILTYTEAAAGGYSRLLWFDRSGRQIAETGSPDNYDEVRISPEGGKLATTVSSVPANDIWVFDLARGTKTRLTFTSSFNVQPAWSPDEKTIAFLSLRSGIAHIYEKAADGTGKTMPLFVDDARENLPLFSSDGRYLIFRRTAMTPGSHSEIWALPLSGDRKAFPVVQNQQFDVVGPALSPDGKWLAYESPESGQPQVYVVPFFHRGRRWQVSPSGGTKPHWRGDGHELFYMSLDNRITSAEIAERGASLVIGNVHALFQANPNTSLTLSYDVTADGKKFVIVSQAAPQATELVTLVVNWPALLNK